MLRLIFVSTIFSKVFERGDSNEIGLYEVPLFLSLLGLCIGANLACFHVCAFLFGAVIAKGVSSAKKSNFAVFLQSGAFT